MRAASRVLPSLLVITICFGQQAIAKEESGAPVPLEQPPCKLVLRVENATFPHPPPNVNGVVQLYSGGSLLLHYELTWSGEQPATIFWGQDAYDNWVRLTITTPLGTKLETSHNSNQLRPERGKPNQFVTLKPGESVTGHCTVGSELGGSQFFRFYEPGLYKLTAAIGLHFASGDPAQADSWKTVGSIAAEPASFGVVRRDEERHDSRLVRGHVRDADGAPVPRADVYAYVERVNYSGPQMQKEFTAYDRAMTDEEGRFAFPKFPAAEPRLMLRVVHRAFPPAQQIIAPDSGSTEQDVDFQLERARTITGTIVDADRRPLSGVTVSRPSLPGLRLPGSDETDANGRFELHGVTTEATVIPARKRDWEVTDESNALIAGDGPTSMTIVLRPRQATRTAKLTGVARFENGEPADNLELTLWINRADGDPRQAQGKTNHDGRFKIELTSDIADAGGPFSGIAELAKGRDHQEAQDRWMARFAIPATDRDVELEFRREHSLTVNLTSIVPLPEELDVIVDVSARPSHGSSRIASQTRKGNELTPLTVRDLTAGRFQVHVEFKGVSHFNAYQDVTIPFEDSEKQHEVTINIPAFHFGSLKVDVRLPDGRKPADDATVEMYGHNMSGFQPVINGVAKFSGVPVGLVYVQCNERDGVVGLPLRGHIETGRETTLGPLVLRTVEEAYGHVSGVVALSDGRPVLGSVVALDNVVSPSAHGPGRRERVNGSGGFRVSAPPDTEFLVVNLEDSGIWPPGSVAEKAVTDSPFGLATGNRSAVQARTRLFVRPVKLKAGHEQIVDVTLPDVAFRAVTLELPAQQFAGVSLWTDLGNAWMKMEGYVGKDGRHTFQYVPDRPTHLTVSAWDHTDRDHWRHQGAAVIDVPVGLSPVVQYDLSQTVALRLRSTMPDEPGHSLSYAVRPFEAEVPAQLAALVGVDGDAVERCRDDEGFIKFRLAPGKYVVTARCDNDEQVRIVELNHETMQQLDFEFATAAE